MANRSTWIAAAVTLAAMVIVAPLANASPSTVDATALDRGMVAELAQTLKISPQAAFARIGREAIFAKTEDKLRTALRGDFGGAYLNADATVLTVAVTATAQRERVLAAGAVPVLVSHSEAALNAVTGR